MTKTTSERWLRLASAFVLAASCGTGTPTEPTPPAPTATPLSYFLDAWENVSADGEIYSAEIRRSAGSLTMEIVYGFEECIGAGCVEERFTVGAEYAAGEVSAVFDLPFKDVMVTASDGGGGLLRLDHVHEYTDGSGRQTRYEHDMLRRVGG